MIAIDVAATTNDPKISFSRQSYHRIVKGHSKRFKTKSAKKNADQPPARLVEFLSREEMSGVGKRTPLVRKDYAKSGDGDT
jgi:hypothetical protein